MDNDDYYSYLGGLGLAVKTLTGTAPSMYVADLTSMSNPAIITLREAFSKELAARYLNPNWITGMMEFDYAGAREIMKTISYMKGWEFTTPDLVTDSDWERLYNTLILDSQNIGVDEFLKENPYQYQSALGDFLNVIMKGSFDASDEILQNLVKEYVESVVENGVTCCHHTCGNPLLDEYVRSVMTTTGVVDVSTAEEYERLMQEATQRTSSPSTQTETASKSRSSSSTGSELQVVQAGSGSTNQTMMSESGAGMDTNTPVQDSAMSTPDNYVEGYEMTRESVTTPDNSGPSFSGSDIIASVLVLAGVGAIYMGFWKRRKM
jgi:cobaltochelatase CobN